MDKVNGFTTLQVGQRIKVKGKPGSNGSFAALEVSIKPADEDVALEGKIQGVDLQKNALRLMNRDFVLLDGIDIKDVQRQAITLKDLKVGEVVKLKGKFSIAEGLKPGKVKLQESKHFSIEELQGDIDKIDPANKTLDVLGFVVSVNEKTEIEGL